MSPSRKGFYDTVRLVQSRASLRGGQALAVILVDPGEPGGRHAASYGNTAWLSPASVVPMSMPGLWRRLPAMLTDPLGPLTIRPAAIPRLLPWLLRFLYAGATVRRVEATARALRPLLEPVPMLHAALAAAAGAGGLIRCDGLSLRLPNPRQFRQGGASPDYAAGLTGMGQTADSM